MIDDYKQKLLSQLKFSFPSKGKGGQIVGSMPSNMMLTSEELDVTITIPSFRSQHRTKNSLIKMFEAYIDSL